MRETSPKIAVVVSLFNSKITLALLDSVVVTLEKSGVLRKDVKVVRVPGAFEIPVVCAQLARQAHYSSVIALGCIIRGDTPHFDYLCREVTRALMDLSLETQKPIIMGVLTTETEEQALERCCLGGNIYKKLQVPSVKPPLSDKGVEFAEAALMMLDVMRRDLSEKNTV